jgi:hypothetical protein
MASVAEDDHGGSSDFQPLETLPQLQIAFAEGAGSFNPLKHGSKTRAFRPGSEPHSTVLCLSGVKKESLSSERSEGSPHFAFIWEKAMSPNRTSVAFVRFYVAGRFFISPVDKH